MEGCPKEIFGSGKKSFIILDNMEVRFCSIVLTLKALRGLGYTDLNKLDEMLVDVGTSFAGMLILFGYSLDGCVLDETELMKQDKKVLYAESGKEFVDLLLIFLAVPLESLWKISGANIKLGCIDTFYKSMKSLSSSEGTTSVLTCTSMLPMNYNFQAPLLDVCRKDSSVWTVLVNSQSYALKLMYPNYDRSAESTVHGSSGFVRRGTTYMISDDLTISPTNSCSTIRILKKLNVGLDEIEEHVINISKTEIYTWESRMYLEINISVVERGTSIIPRNAPTAEDEFTPGGDTAEGAGCAAAKNFLEAADAVLRTFPALIAIDSRSPFSLFRSPLFLVI
ncbi:hypothetical protein DY000_02045658 [Brassica cretica]|uniref:Uncharacterized protein n=1 Tax=Brassica cretica TaxID=69181 RepID=A0ABQ7EQ43_BRACR|nr:hypothetical protein DY000_02045658 [Brassica cretica]